jgi:hypothetical protein
MKITQAELKSRFILRDDGVFVYRRSTGRMAAGMEAGSSDGAGYIAIIVYSAGKAKRYLAHRLVWLWHFGEWPSEQLDHINGVKWDNRIENLRLATASQNGCNRGAQKNNTTGYKGVFANHGKFSGCVELRGKRHYIKPQVTAEEAFVKLQQLRIELHGEFACDGVDK